MAPERRAPLSRTPPSWLPATEVRGEGIFLQLDEGSLRQWLKNKDRATSSVQTLASFEIRDGVTGAVAVEPTGSPPR